MEIRSINSEDYQKFWDNFQSPVFNNSKWLTIVAKGLEVEYYGLFDKEELVNAFPLVVRKGRLLYSITHPPFTPILGGITTIGGNAIKQFIENRKCHQLNYAVSEIVESWNTAITHQIDLTQPQEILYKNLRNDKKRNLKKAEKQGLVVDFNSDYTIIAPLLEKTFERQKHSFQNYAIVQHIIEDYPNHFQVNVSDENGYLASVLIVYDKKTAYYILGGFDYSKNNYNAGPYAMWNAILKAKNKNIPIYDFEGSVVPNIAKYFKSFGGVETFYSSYRKEVWYIQLLNKIMKWK